MQEEGDVCPFSHMPYPIHTDALFTCCFYLFIVVFTLRKENMEEEKKQKKAEFKSEYRRNGESGPDRGNDAKSQSLAAVM